MSRVGRQTAFKLVLFVFILFFGIFQAGAGDCASDWKLAYMQVSSPKAWLGMATSPNRMVAVGDIGITAYSTNGKSFTLGENEVYPYNHVAYGNGKFVAVGWQGWVATSTDGAAWNRKKVDSVDIWTVIFIEETGQFMAAGNGGKILTSSNGTSWSSYIQSFRKTINGLAYGNGKYIAACSDGYILTSSDGKSWTKTQPTTQHLFAASYGNGVYVVGGRNSAVLSSENGTSWKARTSNGGENNIRDAIWTGNQFVMVGEHNGGGKSSVVIVSADGINWTRKESKATAALFGVTYNPSFGYISAMGSWDTRIYSTCSDNGGGSGGTPNVTVTSPKGGEKWVVGSTQDVTWTSFDAGLYLKMEYSINDGSTWVVFDNSGGNDGYRKWVIPDVSSDACRIRLTSTSNSSLYGISERFSIYSPNNITVTSPNGGNSWTAGTTYSITWNSEGDVGKTVKIEYSKDGASSFNTIVSSTDNDGIYEWLIPGTVDSTDCYIRISDVSNLNTTDMSNSAFTITAPPQIKLDRSNMNFGYATGGSVPLAQTLGISNIGGGTLSWNISSDVSWLAFTPASGSGNAYVDVTLVPGSLSAGTYTANITVTSSGAVNSPQTMAVKLVVKSYSQDSPPFGDFATPEEGAVVSGSVPITGWVLDDIEVSRVTLYYGNGIAIGNAVFVEGARSDIEDEFPDYPKNAFAGWGYMMLSNSLSDGTYRIYAIAADNSGNQRELGSATVTIDNANATKPYGAIDSPAQGGDASGSRYVNWGWAVTPLPNMIPTNGSTIEIYVDSMPLGQPYEYNVPNPDVKKQFPDVKNADGPTAYLHIDTTEYENGIHTISWTVTDDAGNRDGIGSRYFTVRNTGSDARSAASSLDETQVQSVEMPKRRFVTKQGAYRYVDEIAGIAPAVNRVGVKRGYHDEFGHDMVEPVGSYDPAVIQLRENDRVQLNLNEGSTEQYTYTGYMVVGSKLTKLPVGSYLDNASGQFGWQVGPGFVGCYKMVFIGDGPGGQQIRKHIEFQINPKHQ